MPFLLLPRSRRRADLRGFWLAVCLLLLIVGGIIWALWSPAAGAVTVALVLAGAIAGFLRPGGVLPAYRSWNRIAIAFAAGSSEVILESCRRALSGGETTGGSTDRVRAARIATSAALLAPIWVLRLLEPDWVARRRRQELEETVAAGAAAAPLWLVVAALGLPLLALDVVAAIPFLTLATLSWLGARVLEPTRVYTWPELLEFEPVIGWRGIPNRRVHAIADEVFPLTTDHEGWRGTGTLAESEIVVFGDSFAFGYGSDDRTYFGGAACGVRIKSVGINGYNMVQSYLWMERYAPRLRGKLAVWMIYLADDLYENLRPNLGHYRMPYLSRRSEGDDWEIVTSHVRPRRWPHPPERQYRHRFAEICSPTSLSSMAFSASDFLIRRAVALWRGTDVRFAVVTVPDIYQIDPERLSRFRKLATVPEQLDPDLPDRVLAESCARAGVPFLALKDHLGPSDYKLRDVHWTESGHRRVAELLEGLYARHVRGESIDLPAREPAGIVAEP